MSVLKRKLIDYRYLIGFLILCFILLIPFALKIIDSRYEPYPSIILPSGEWMAQLKNGNYAFVTYSLYGYDLATDSLRKLDTREFLNPIPPTYIYGLSSIYFGVQERKTPFLRDKLLMPNNRDNQKMINNSKFWLAKKLEKQGCRNTTLIIKVFNSQINNPRRAIVKTTLIDKKIINISQ